MVAHHVAQLLVGHATAGHAAAAHAVAGHAVAAHVTAAVNQSVGAHLAAAHAAAGHAAAAHAAGAHAAAGHAAASAHGAVVQILGTSIAAGTLGGLVLANFLNNILNDLYKQVKNGAVSKLTKPELAAFINAASSDVRADFRRRNMRLDSDNQLEITRITRDMIDAVAV